MWVLQGVNDARSPNEKILHIAIYMYITMLKIFHIILEQKYLFRGFIDMNTPKLTTLLGY